MVNVITGTDRDAESEAVSITTAANDTFASEGPGERTANVRTDNDGTN